MAIDGRLEGHGEPPVYFTFPGLTKLGVPHATTTRHCPGVGVWSDAMPPFRPDAAATLAPAGLDLTRVSWVRQVHGAEVARATTAGGLVGRADVVVVTEPGAPGAIFTADCLALIAYEPAIGQLSVAHVGWRGAVRGAAQAAVAALVAAGGHADRLWVTVSPSIGPCCYEVDAPVIAEFAAAYPERWEPWVTAGRPGHWMLDLWSTAETLLERAGVRRERIENPRVCTACHPELLYSHRKGNRGRLVTLAGLP
jgi:hypothetical protein